MKPLRDVGAFSNIVGRIYAAGLNPERWQDVVQALSAAGGGMKTQLFGHDKRSGLNIGMVTSGYDPEYLAAYADHFGAINPWIRGVLSTPAGTVLNAAEMCPFEEMSRSEFYNDWVRPQGDIRGGGGLLLFHDAQRLIMLGANIENGEIDRKEQDWLRLCALLKPHLEQAFEVSRQMAGSRLETMAAQSAPQATLAVLLVSAAGQIVHASARAQTMLARGEILACDHRSRLRFVDSHAEASYRKAAAALQADQLHDPVSFPLSGGSETAKTCRILAFHGGAEAAGALELFSAVSAPCLLICIAERPGLAAYAARLAHFHGLTTAEAEVAIGIADGHSVSELSERRGVSRHTTRNQLKAVMAKCNTPRQADLVRRVLALSDGYPM